MVHRVGHVVAVLAACSAALRRQSRHRQSPPSTGIGSSRFPPRTSRCRTGCMQNSVPQPEQARRRTAADFLTDLSSNEPNLGRVFHVGFIPERRYRCARNIRPATLKGNPMARDSQAALVALNRFGLGARGGASGDFVNAASDPRGFVKAELSVPTACCWKCPGCNRRRRSARKCSPISWREAGARRRREGGAPMPRPEAQSAPPAAG